MFGTKTVSQTHISPHGQKYVVVKMDFSPLVKPNKKNGKRLPSKVRVACSIAYAIVGGIWDLFTEIPTISNSDQSDFDPIRSFRWYKARFQVINTELWLKGW